MKRLLTTMFHLYFFERTAYWLFAAGVLITIASQFGSPPIVPIGFLLGAVLLAGFPLMWISILFNINISNRHLSLVPKWNQYFLGATFFLMLLLSLYLSSVFFLFPKKLMVGVNITGIFLTVFCTSSLLLFMMKYILKNRFIPLITYLLLIAIYNIFKPSFSESPKLDSPLLLSIMFLLSLAIWLSLIFRIKKVGTINKTYTSEKNLYPFEGFTSKGINPMQISGFQTLMRGSMFNNQRRWVSFLVIYTGFPIIFVTLLSLFTSEEFKVEWLLALQYIGLLMLAFASGEWMIRLRFLWLKVSGNRHQFWLLWKKNLHTDLGLTFLFLSIYYFLVNLFFDVIPLFLAIYVFAIFIVLPSTCYFSTWINIKGGIKNPLAAFLSIGYGIVVAISMLMPLAQKTYMPLIWCGIFFVASGLISYLKVKKEFLTLDWIKHRPVNKLPVGPGWT